jgi:hypothetical protein
LLLWIPLVEEREKVSIRQVLEARRVVGHAVRVAREVLGPVTVAVEPLMVNPAAAPTVETAPLCTRDTAGVLSEKFSTVA